MKRKQIDLYLSNEDIEKLNARYEVLYKKVKDSPNLTKEQINRECEVLLAKYNFEIEELSALREADYRTRQAQIVAKNREQIPWRRCWLWRLLLQPLTNRAQDIIEEEAQLDADDVFSASEQTLEERISKIYAADGQKLSTRARKRALKQYLKYKHVLEADNALSTEPQQPAVVDAPPSEAPAPAETPSEAEEPPAPPLRQTRSAKQTGV